MIVLLESPIDRCRRKVVDPLTFIVVEVSYSLSGLLFYFVTVLF